MQYTPLYPTRNLRPSLGPQVKTSGLQPPLRPARPTRPSQLTLLLRSSRRLFPRRELMQSPELLLYMCLSQRKSEHTYAEPDAGKLGHTLGCQSPLYPLQFNSHRHAMKQGGMQLPTHDKANQKSSKKRQRQSTGNTLTHQEYSIFQLP